MILSADKKDLVYAGYTILLIKYVLSTTSYALNDTVGYVFVGIGLFLLICKIITSKYSRKEVYASIFMIIIGLLSLEYTQDDTLLILCVMIISLKETDIMKIIKIYLYVNVGIFLFTVGFSIITSTNLYNIADYRGLNYTQKRYTLGYVHPNSLQQALMRIFGAVVLVMREWHIKKIIYIFFEVINLGLFLLTDSRTGFLVNTLMLIGLWLVQDFKIIVNKKAFLRIAEISFILTVLFTLYAVFSYGNNALVVMLDTILTGRFSLAYRYGVCNYNITLLGNDLTNMSGLIDCGIYQSLLAYGLIVYVVFLLCYIRGIYRLWELKKPKEIVIVICFTLYCVTEAQFSNIFTNIGLLLCVYYCLNERKKPVTYRGFHE